MARGRFISRSVITDRGIHELSSDTCRLAFTWLITTADREGRTVGEPELLIALLFPRRRDVTPEMMAGFIQEWISAGFVVVYQASDGDQYLQFVNFEKHQVGLRKDREPKSDYESPTNCRIIGGSLPQTDAEMQVNVNENVNLNDNDNVNENDNKQNNSAQENEFAKVWEKEMGSMVSNAFQFLQMVDEFIKVGVTPEIYRQAIREQKKSEYPVKSPTSVQTWAIGMVTKKKVKPAPESVSDQNARVGQEVMAEMAKGKL